ncbi:isochorismate synthase [Prochlorococcus sp. MIT 1300]|uniref:isochorismate synthase n=1 Tax=Prochlorococcus sp. MIT 1300 TaxID=3096218 RepID=UPI002A75F7BE|nr:isochorismate synthase [Prochlorococcus sp. MIT 1300]
MTAGSHFSNIVTSAAKGWRERDSEEGVLSLALRLQGIDPLHHLPLIAVENSFRFLWDGAPGLTIAAAGVCQQLDLVGPRRFAAAQKFADNTLGRITDVNPEAPAQARPRIMLAFSFFEYTAERLRTEGVPPSVHCVLPRWQLSRQGRFAWLRLNGVVTQEAEARELAEELCMMSQCLVNANSSDLPESFSNGSVPVISSGTNEWQKCYRPALARGIELVNTNQLHKLVLAVRQSIELSDSLEPLNLLARLRSQQAGSCRFLWQQNATEAFFGASPERLLSLRRGRLCSDALAGTATAFDNGEELLSSDKDLREHELVVTSIIDQLVAQGIRPFRTRMPQLAKHGRLIHLHTPITAQADGYKPLGLADALHPTPAVAGLPRKEAMSWLRTLEPFERGGYAGPIGWIDSSGDCELRVAIRCGNMRGKILDLTAGAGLVRGSLPDKELDEVSLKLAVLADQFDIKPISSSQSID